MLTRRRLGLLPLALTISAWIAGAGAARSEGGPKRQQIAILGPGRADCPLLPPGAAFNKGLEDLGYGSRLSIVARCFSELADLPRLVDELLDGKPAVVVVWGSVVAVRAVRRAAPAMPVVFVDVTDPVQFGLVESLGRPGGHTTGISNITDDLLAKRVQLLRDALPQARRLAVLCDLANPLQADYLRVTQAAARAMGFETRSYPVQAPEEIDIAFAAMAADRMDAMVLQPDAWFFPNRQRIIELAARYRLPAVYGNSEFPRLGALFTYGVDLNDMSYRAAAYVDKILKGVEPASLPVELPTKFNFVINARTARALGLDVPHAVMVRATQVIE